jgi:disulfide bond formation protein DsbB
MSAVETVSLFLGLLALLCQVTTIALVALAVAARFSQGAAQLLTRVRADVGPRAIALAAAVAIVSTFGSLYYSEVADFPPCRLCWYQRIAMYPLALMLGLAARWRDVDIRRYAGPLAGVGAVIATYHVLVERFPSLESGACELTNPCSIIWVESLGYLTIPVMALSGFAVILTLLVYATKES